MLSAGLVGLPNSGKTTIFNIVCKASAEIAPYPFTTKSKNEGVMAVWDERLEKLAKILRSSQVVPAQVKLFDVAGLVKGAHKGEGLGNEFLSYIRPLDFVIFVVRDFEVAGEKPDPTDAFLTVWTEIVLSDIQILERNLEKVSKPAKLGVKEAQKEKENIERMLEELNGLSTPKKINLTPELAKIAKKYGIISTKPFCILINTERRKEEWENIKKEFEGKFQTSVYVTDALAQLELDEKEVEEMGETPIRKILSEAVRKGTGAVIFYTGFEGKELRAWITTPKTVFDVAGMIHTDMQKGFISADVSNFSEYSKFSSDKEASHTFRTVTRDYIVQDGDIIRIKFKV